MINKNELPQNWELKKLGEVCEKIVGGGTPSTSNPEFWDGDIPWISSADIFGLRNIKPRKGITKKAIEKSTTNLLPEGGIIVVTRVGLGKIAIAPFDLCFSQDSQGLILNEKIISKSYALLCLSKAVQMFKYESRGTTISGVTKKQLVEVEVPLPPLAEQERIVAKIEELFSELDSRLESLKTAQSQLKTYRQVVLKYAFEGKLTEKWRKENNTETGKDVLLKIESKRTELLKNLIAEGNREASRLLNKLKKHSVNLSETPLPNKWVWSSFLEACQLVVDCHNKTAPYEESGIFLVRTSNIKNGKLNLNDNIRFVSDKTYDYWSRRCPPKSDDILFTREAPMGDAAIIPSNTKVCMGQRIMLLRTFPDLLLPKYLHYAIMDPVFQERMDKSAIGTGVKHLRVGDTESLTIPICSTEEQQHVVEEIESRLSICDKLEETINASLKQAEALRQSILKQAFEGKLVKPKEIEKPKRTPFYQMQTLGLIIDRSKQRNIHHSEMTLAKYAFLAEKIYGVPIYENYQRLHLGPYPTEIKKTVNNREYFKIENNTIQVLNEEKLFRYHNDYKEQIESAVDELAEIFSSFEPKDRPHKTELLATVCKVIEDIQTTKIEDVRQSMAEWKIDLRDKRFNTKAEKFDQDETAKCIEFIKQKGWDKKLIN